MIQIGSFCRRKMLRGYESYGIDYIVGIGGNIRLKQFSSTLINQSEEADELTSDFLHFYPI